MYGQNSLYGIWKLPFEIPHTNLILKDMEFVEKWKCKVYDLSYGFETPSQLLV